MHTGITTAPIFDWMQPCPAHDTFPFRDECCPTCRFQLVSRRRPPVVCQQSSLVTFPGTVTTAKPLVTFPAPCSQGPTNLLMVCSVPGGRGPADKGPTLIIVGKGEGAPDEWIDYLGRLDQTVLSYRPTAIGHHPSVIAWVPGLRHLLCPLHVSQYLGTYVAI